ncbi:MAG: Sir2 family NAD-dependent protein deacetylase, partial [Syntrophothermus sp.]
GSRTVYELHGNIERNFCVRCGRHYDQPEFKTGKKVPECECGGLIRPDVVWFGEMLPEDQFVASEAAAHKCDVMFITGTSAVVYPAAQIPLMAKEWGAWLVEVNIERTEISNRSDFTLFGKSGEILPALLEEIKTRRENGQKKSG